MKVFRAEKKHIHQLCELVNSCYRGETSRAGWTTEADFLEGQRIDNTGLLEIVNSNAEVILCLGDEDRILACSHLSLYRENCVLIGMLSVSPSLQNQGLGARLIQESEKFARLHFCAEKALMKVLSLRTELIAYYERKNYVRKEERERFPYGQERFGIPKRDDLEFISLEKTLT